MRRLYYIIRGISYACGIAALFLIMLGRGSAGEYADTMIMAGYILVTVMFALFCSSYILFLLIRKK
jgi:hypothetical protein